MASQIAAIADAVKTALDNATLSQAFTPERVYVPYTDLPDAADLHVFVMPEERVIAKRDRGGLQSDVRIGVTVVKRVAGDPQTEDANAEIDALLQLTEEITALFGPGNYGGARWLATENPALFDQDMLNSGGNVFRSYITLTFKLF